MTTLSGKEIVLGVTGGIAAYKACEIVRALRKEGAGVRVILTASGARFITPLTLQTLSKNPVSTDLFDLITESDISHISLAQRANLLMIAPATANILGKIRSGIADDMLSTVAMATAAPAKSSAVQARRFTTTVPRGGSPAICDISSDGVSA